MAGYSFSKDDIKQIRDHGLTLEEVERQLELFEMPPSYLRLYRPCIAGDGITVIDEKRGHTLKEIFEQEAPKRACLKFVPASGAATRMFKTLLHYQAQGKGVLREAVLGEAQAGQKDAVELVNFMEGIRNFAFFDELASTMREKGYNLDELIERGQFTEVIDFVLTEKGLNYSNQPKGLLKFHYYPEGSRTAFEEHLVEAANYVADQNGSSALHLTVSEEHLEEFQYLFEKLKRLYEDKYKLRFAVSFPIQKEATDTLAVDLDNRPFRQRDGRLLFRPGGHGALIENLNDLEGDILFIKNIDNVVPDRLKPETYKWKKILGGYLISIQRRAFNYMERLESADSGDRVLDEAMAFLKEDLFQPVPVSMERASHKTKKAFLVKQLDRPIRVCGMVRNVDEPGGGPFWAKERSGEISRQIVETAQIDPDSQEQQAILGSSTHFNPVDLVCGVRDWKGRAFDLRKFVDPRAVFITRKSKDGKDLKALEHPGLWNGAMAGWITLFVEVPRITFNPVKTINDLLRKEHQPG
ncbi:MAG: DUF4301 family protein [Pseudomonadota bacterium]